MRVTVLLDWELPYKNIDIDKLDQVLRYCFTPFDIKEQKCLHVAALLHLYSDQHWLIQLADEQVVYLAQSQPC